MTMATDPSSSSLSPPGKRSIAAGVEKIARDDDEAILWLIYGDDSCSDSNSNNDSNSDGMAGGDQSPHYRRTAFEEDKDNNNNNSNSNSGSGSGRYLYVEYLDWMDPDGAILGTHNNNTAATTIASNGGNHTSRSTSFTTVGGSSGHSEKETPLSSPLASYGPASVAMGGSNNNDDDSRMATSNSPETNHTAHIQAVPSGGGVNGASSLPMQDMGEIKVRTNQHKQLCTIRFLFPLD